MTPEQIAELNRRLEVFAEASDEVETYLYQIGYDKVAGEWLDHICNALRETEMAIKGDTPKDHT